MTSDETSPPPRADAGLLGPLAGWVGTWRGDGHGDYPTIAAFDYVEEVVFRPTGKPVLSYRQRTRGADGRPLHAESGWLRLVGGRSGPPNDRISEGRVVEWVIAQPTGLVEAAAGSLQEGVLEVASTPSGTPSAVSVTDVRRRYHRRGDELSYDLWMATEPVPVRTHHLAATLRRVVEPSDTG